MKKAGKKWFAFDFEEEKSSESANLYEPRPDLLKKSNNYDLPVVNKRSFNFYRHLTPKTVADLAVHPKKINEVELWLQNNVCNKPKNCQTARFLLITGPTGSGKTSTIRVLCDSMSVDLSEWVNPMDQDFEVFRGPNQVTRFAEFLTEAKWNSLFSHGNKKIILVEEFPNALMRSPQEFMNVLEDCYYKGNYPIVFICTDSCDNRSNLSQVLFPQEIRDKYSIAHISFNSCAATLMKNALKRAHGLVQDNLDLFRTPSPSTVTAIIATSMGDIRCAINQYYFASLLGTSDLPTKIDKVVKKIGNKRKRGDNASSVQSMSRDETLDLFHGLGRVLNPKRQDVGNSWRFACDIDKLIDEFSTQPSIFTAFLFENYIKYFGDVKDASEASEILSCSQTFLEKWVDRHDVLIFALWVSVLGLMVHNEHRVSRWNPITGPKKIQKRINSDPRTRNLSVTDLFYCNIINKSGKQQFNTDT
jgi:cell cycle checkpoint protein